MTRAAKTTTLAIAVLLTATACRGSQREPATGPQTEALVAAAAASENPPSGDKIYRAKCAMCHGEDGVAGAAAKGSADLNDPEWQQSTSFETIETVIRDGKGTMPAFGRLSAAEISAIAQYVRTLDK